MRQQLLSSGSCSNGYRGLSRSLIPVIVSTRITYNRRMHQPSPTAIVDAVRVIRQIGAVNEVALMRHLLAAEDERLEQFLRFEAELMPDATIVELVRREGNANGLVRAAIDRELRRYAGRRLPHDYAAKIQRKLERLLGCSVDRGQICRRRATLFPRRKRTAG
jgi:hypothetical protein